MNAIYLHLPDGTPTKWSMCTECDTVAAPGNFDISEKCCKCYDCGLPLAPNERTKYGDSKGRYSLYHPVCERKRYAKHEADMLEAAEVLADWDGPVYFTGVRGGWGDGFWPNIHELVDALDDEETGKSSRR